jgi:hypothetical protein
MFARNRFTRSSFAVLAASGALVIASCGDSSDFGVGKRFPVSGTVTYNGAPLEKGQINFMIDASEGAGAGAMGAIENGSYVLSTVGDKDGARPGKYKVTVVSKLDSEDQAKAAFEKAKLKFSGDVEVNTSRVPKGFMVKAAREAKDLVPAGYGDLRTTTLTAEVKEQENKIDFKLTDADAPPAPPAAGQGRGRRR